MLLALALLAAPAAPAAAQPALAPLTDAFPTNKGTVGVSFALPGGGAPTVGATYFLNNDLAARVDFGLDATFSPSGTPAGFRFDVALRFYTLKHDRVAIFLQPEIDFGRDKGSATEFLAFGGGAGIEYFFTNNFSVGGALGLQLLLNNIGGPAGSSVGVELTTGTTALFASFYF